MLLCLPASLFADQLRFDTAEEWQQWKLPLGAVELSAAGIIQPVKVRQHINAALDARAFGGGIRGAGSNQSTAGLVMDGDPATGWSPNWSDPPEDWWIEIDLGRVVSAQQLRLVFAEETPPFEIFDLLLSTGEQARNNIGILVPGTLIYRVRERFRENSQHQVRFVSDQLDQSVIQVLRVELLKAAPGAKLVEVEIEVVGDNLALDLLERGGGVDVFAGVDSRNREAAVPLGNILGLMDGNINTRLRLGDNLGGPTDVDAHFTLNLGAVYAVDRVRLISGLVPAQFCWTCEYRKYFDFRLYEILTSTGALAPDGGLVWQKQFSGFSTEESQEQGLADHHFSLVPTQYIRVGWKSWDVACAVALKGREASIAEGCSAAGNTTEIQVYGGGYPQEARLRSPLIDLKGDHHLNTLRWQGRTPLGTRVEFRSRTGNELAPQVAFHDKNGKEVTQKKWEKLVPSFRGSIDTTLTAGSDWSPWSQAYLVSGEEFQSPSPRHYLELEARLISTTPDAAASLDWLAVEFSAPLAASVVGEIFPVEAEPGVEREFSYFLKAPATSSGFDRLSIEASTPLHFAAAALDDVHIAAEVQPNGKGFQVKFPRPVRQGELVEVRFDATIFLYATRFEAFLEDSRQEVRQRVEPGNATDQVESSTDAVRLPLASNLLASLFLSSRALTPNGDRINDELRIAFALVNVLAERPLRLQLFDLSGRRVWEEEKEGLAGAQEFAWDGRDRGGALVPPGMYILRLEVEGDARTETVNRLVSVVY